MFGALLPIALGHALAIGPVVLLVYIVGAVVPFRWLQVGGAATLLVIAIWKLGVRDTQTGLVCGSVLRI